MAAASSGAAWKARLRQGATLGLLVAAYVAAGRLGLSLASVNPSATAVWPPTGIAIAALLLLGRRAWPAVFAGAFLVNVLTAGGAVVALGIAAGNTLEALLAAWLVGRFAGGARPFDRTADVACFALLAGGLGTMVSATVGVSVLVLAGLAPASGAPAVWLTWWLGDAVGALVVAPLLLVWAVEPRPRGFPAARLAEAGLLAAMLAAVGWLVLAGGASVAPAGQLRYLAIPPVLWAAFRFGQRGTATVVAALAALSVAGGLQRPGAAGIASGEALLDLQLFMGVVSVTGLLLGAALVEARRARAGSEALVQERTRALVEAQRIARIGSWEWDLGTGRVAWSEEMYRIYGYDARFDVTYERAMERVHPEDQARIRENTQHHLRDAVPPANLPPVEYRIQLPGGGERVLLGQGSLVPGAPGGPPRLVGTVQDVTERRRAEELFRGLVEAAPDAMVIVDEAGRIVLANDQAERLFGYARAEMVGQPVEMLIPDRFRAGHVRHRQGFNADPHRRAMGAGVELFGRRRDGKEFPVEVSLSPLRTAGGTLVSSAIRDITDRKRAEAELRRSQSMLAKAEHMAHVGSWEWDVVADRVAWSEEMLRIYGQDAATFRGSYQAFLDAVHPDDRERARAAVEEAFRTGAPFSFEHRIVRPDGAVRTLHAQGEVQLGADGRAVRMSGTGQDITERRQAEVALAQLRDLERLKEMDAFKTQFLNAAAHELGTPLTPIRLQLDLLREAGVDERGRRSVDILDRNVRRLSDLVRDILEAARLQAGRLGVRKRRVDLALVVRDTAEAFEEPARRGNVALEVRVPGPLWVDADPDRMAQVVLNLLTNAWKFTPPGGRIVVEAAAEGGEVRVVLRDTGIGMQAEQVARLFQPFSQVHEGATATRGTGLGLYISKGIVEVHGGRMWAESAGAGLGSTFGFALPAAPPPADAPGSQANPRAQAGAKR